MASIPGLEFLMRGEGMTPQSEIRNPKSLRTKLLAAIHACAHQHGIAKARLYELASGATGRILAPGFGLSTCSDVELGKIVENVKAAAGLPVGSRQSAGGSEQGPRGSLPTAHCRLPTGSNVVRLASIAALQFLRSLVEQARLSEAECAGVFRKACGTAQPKTAAKVFRCTEAVKQIKGRRQLAVGSGQGADGRRSDRTDQSDPTDPTDRTPPAIEKISQLGS